MPAYSHEGYCSTPVCLRHFCIIFSQSDHGGDPGGVVASRVEPAVTVSHDVNRLVCGARQGAPDSCRLLTGYHLGFKSNLDMRRPIGGRFSDHISERIAVLHPQSKRWNLPLRWVPLNPEITRQG